MKVERPQGFIAVEVVGTGPLVLCVPGMGESQASFRHLIPGLTQAGYRVATMDLRGHGDSSTSFSTYDDHAAATDILAVISALDADSAVVLGNSMGAAAAVIAAWQSEKSITGLVLIGPFLRDHASPLMRLLTRIALSRPWGPWIWHHYYLSLFGSQTPADHVQHTRQALALLKRPGRWVSFQRTARTSHQPAREVLQKISVPTLVIMGDKDPDFPDPEAEATWAAAQLSGTRVMIPQAGHYPMGEQPEAVLNELLPFLDSTR